MADNFDVDGDDRPVTSQGRGPGRPSARKKWLRRTLTVGIAVLALGGFGMIVLNAYDTGKGPADDKAAPLIRADGGPSKVRPQNPGGMEVPNQDKQVFGRIAPGDSLPPVERLIPPPEATVARPPPPPPAPAAPQPAPPQQPTAAEPAAGLAPPPPAAPAAPLQASPAPKPEPPRPAPAAAPAPRPQKAALPKGGYRIQIAAVRSEAAAKRAWADLSKRHADLFGKLDSTVVRADLGQKGVYWRLQVGPLASADAAQALCSRAKQRKLGCIVVKP